MKKWKTLSSVSVLDNKWMKIHKETVEHPSGRIIDDYYVWDYPDVVLVVAITDENKILLVTQYKHGGRDFYTEVPAGLVEEGEDKLVAAKRELEEETGYVSKDVKLLKVFIDSPTKKRGSIYVYLARGAKKVKDQSLDENEEISVGEYSFDEVLDMIYSDKICVTGTIASIYAALTELNIKI